MTQKRYQAKAARDLAQQSEQAGQVTTATIRHQSYEHSGPLPDPQTLTRYNEIIPDAAERILAMAEQNAEHYRQLERMALAAQVDDNNARHRNIRRGQIAAILSVAASFAIAGYALYLGHAAVSGTICSVTVIGLVATFVTGRSEEKTPDEKTE